MKKLLMAVAAFGMAFSFTACDSDASSSSGSGKLLSCDMTTSFSMGAVASSSRMCTETANTAEAKAALDENCVSDTETEDGVAYSYTAKKGNGCASGYSLKCDFVDEDDGSTYTAYFYDAALAKVSCDEMKNSLDY